MKTLFFRIKFIILKFFTIASDKISDFIGSPWGLTLFVASVIILVKLQATFASDSIWTTIGTVLQVLSIILLIINQTSQNRDTKAIMVKLNGLILANTDADNKLIGVEKKEQVEIIEISEEIRNVVEKEN